MIRLITLAIVALFTFPLYAQELQLPELSPTAHLNQEAGYTNFHIRYGRPAARGRVIMGSLVKYNWLWRTGAGKSTVIAFDQPVEIGGTMLSP